MTKHWYFIVPIFAACGDDGDSKSDTADTTADSTPDTNADTSVDSATDTGTADTVDTTDTQATDTAAPDTRDTAVDSADVVANEWDFPIRLPTKHTVTCEGGPMPDTTMEAPEVDWLCTFDDGTVEGVVYTQATPTSCQVTLSEQPVFDSGAGWLWRDGQALAELTDVVYDWGGNHHNDSLELTFGGKKYRYYHSSFGFGWRKCQPMDCLQVRDGAGTMLSDGCTADRSLPVVCRQVAQDGTWDELVDTFAKCPGDPNN